MTATLIRERPPLRLDLDVATPEGRHARWASDAPRPADVPGSLTFSDTMPGGFEQCSCVLARPPAATYADLEELSTVTVRGPGRMVAWQGRLEKTPRASGDQVSITPNIVGWQAHLDDNADAQMIYVDRDLTHWQGPSVQRQLSQVATYNDQGAAVTPDASTGAPSLACTISSPWGAAPGLPLVESFYDGLTPNAIASIYYAWKINANLNSGDANWLWGVGLTNSDAPSSADFSGNLRGAGPGSGKLNASGAGKRFAFAQLEYQTSAVATVGVANSVFWTALAVYGPHGLTGRGSDPVGFFASDIVGHALATWAPKLATVFAGVSTIRPTSFVIPQAAYLDPTTASQIVKDATRFELPDWAVWEGPVFWYYPRPSRTAALDVTLPPKRWRARVGQAQLSETGPQVDRLFNGVVVQYTDVTGVNRTVGPPGSSALVTDTSLQDSDPLNPLNEAGITRWTLLQMGVCTSAGAIKVGALYLSQQKLLDSSGQAVLTGHVEDDHGVLWPAWRVRSGDQISFTDSQDTSYRRIVRAAYDDATKARTISLDAPPQGVAALLERLQVVIAPLGF